MSLPDTFKPNLATEPDAKYPLFWNKLASPKLDGIRCVIDDEGKAYSRSLKPIPNKHIQRVLRAYRNLDGELIVGSPTHENCYWTTNSAVMTHDGEPEFQFYVFDRPLSSSQSFAVRQESIWSEEREDEVIRLLPHVLLKSGDECAQYYENLLADGYEGAILRNPNALYKHGRSTAKSQDMLKLKPFKDDEAIVTGVYEAMFNGNEAFTNELGRTARSTAMAGLEGKGMIGGFFARDLVSGVEFDCSAGKSTHDQRRDWWVNQPIGRILKYRHMPIGVKDKPRSPRFIGWRSVEDMS